MTPIARRGYSVLCCSIAELSLNPKKWIPLLTLTTIILLWSFSGLSNQSFVSSGLNANSIDSNALPERGQHSLSEDPIQVLSDDDWSLANPDSGVGSEIDPYIIENRTIDASGGSIHGIEIRNTEAYFIIQNSVISGANPGAGILLWNVTNGILLNNTCLGNNDAGIFLGQSGMINLTLNDCGTNGNGIKVTYSSYNTTVSNNTLSMNRAVGLYLDDTSKNTTVYFNVFEDNGENAWNDGVGIGDVFHHNYWSNYKGTIIPPNEIGITPHEVLGLAKSTDYYPLVFPPGHPKIHWNVMPTDQSFNYGEVFSYKLEVVAYGGLSFWTMNDTQHFNIDSDGLIGIVGTLAIGIYGLNVSANDLFENSVGATFNVAVQDILPPKWSNEPTDQTWELGTEFSYFVGATDLSGIGTWGLNDTQFSVDTSGAIGNATFVSVGSYGLNLTVNDTLGNTAFALLTIDVVDTTVPMWIASPAYQQVDYGYAFRYDINASDISGIDTWWLSDNTFFEIDINGIITNATTLPFGTDFVLQVSVNDTYGNVQTSSLIVEVIDSVPPNWVQGPTDQILECGNTLELQLSATDNIAVSHWTVNDTTHFAITSLGRIFSIGILQPGIYGLEVTVYDPGGNTNTGTCRVTVLDTLAPTWSETPEDHTIEFDGEFIYQLTAYDSTGLDAWWIDDTTHFSISNDGLLESLGSLEVGEYDVQISVSDTQGHVLSHTLTVTVEDTTPPTWVVIPADQFIAEGQQYSQQLQPTDLSGISQWTVNDTTHFAISESGLLSNVMALRPGTYGLRVTAEDPYGNGISAELIITVESGDGTPMGVIVAGIGVAGVVVILAVLAHPRGRKVIRSLREG